ncbi:MAG: hydantoinase/oxoprolinase family protein [Alphaproteobacteria bacterium]|nr:hydantoinase/oxoprolinase family protein [Alphaproteobacteria bacterium]
MTVDSPEEPDAMSDGSRFRIGVDIGGTFTDFCLFDEMSGTLRSLKTLSTPDRPGEEVMTGIGELEHRFACPAGAIASFVHGTTVGVNTVIQRRGAELALFTTREFEDVLEVARLKVPDPYNIFSRRAPPLAPRERVYGIAERTLLDGTIESPVDPEDVAAAVSLARADGADTIVVALLHAYANPTSERAVRDAILAADPDLGVTLSSDVWPVIREYERTVTATVAAYVQRRVAGYITSLQAALGTVGVPAVPMVTKSNGGIMAAELGKTNPVAMLLSGTASGVIGAADIAARTGEVDVLSYDVGGTSADVAVIRSGSPAFGTGEMVGEFPIYVPTVSVTSIGAGGGSIARVDDFGVLKVGPESAGSSPGPACFGRGGTDATITDAFAVLGLLGGKLGYGTVTLDREAAEHAVGALARRLGMSLVETGESIIRVAVAGMYLETSKLLARTGADPRGFALLAFGGAGPMTACLLARELGMKRVIVPPLPGVLSAYGGLIADIRNDFIRTAFVDLDPDGLTVLDRHADDLEARALAWLRGEQGFAGPASLVWSADMRYRGQSYEIETVIDRSDLAARRIEPVAEAFHREHHAVYEHADPEAPVQVVNLRLVIRGSVPRPEIARNRRSSGRPPVFGTGRIRLDGADRDATLYRRTDLAAGQSLSGPAIVIQDDCTSVIPAGFTASVDDWANLIIEPET